jgi:hypothetical protein
LQPAAKGVFFGAIYDFLPRFPPFPNRADPRQHLLARQCGLLARPLRSILRLIRGKLR